MKALTHVATLMEDGSPQVSPVWIDREDGIVVFNKGRVVEITEKGADEHIDRLAKRYLDADEYPFRQPGEVRLKVRVRPERVSHTPGG